MSGNKLLIPLLEIAKATTLSEDDLEHMLCDEVSRLSADARIHDFIHVLAVKRVTDKLRLRVTGTGRGKHMHAKEVQDARHGI